MKRIFLWGMLILFLGANGSVGFARTGSQPEKKPFDGSALFPSWKGSTLPEKYDAYLSDRDRSEITKLNEQININKTARDTAQAEVKVSQSKIEELQWDYDACFAGQIVNGKDSFLQDDCSNVSGMLESAQSDLKAQQTIVDSKNLLIQDFQNKISSIRLKATQVQGIVGRVDDQRFLMNYLPRLIDILLKFISPIILIIFIYAGVRFIYAQDDEEDLTKSKQFFIYTLMGVLFVILSYSIMKALYFILSTAT